MPYLGNTAGNRFVASKAATQFSGDGSTTAFTLDHAVGSDEDILVSVDGVIQEPSVAYAVSNGTTLTFTAAPSSNSGNNIFVYYLFRTVATVDHPSTSSLQATDATFTGAFTSKGIDDNADATAITIDSSEHVGIGTTSPDGTLHIHSASAGSVTANTEADELVVENSGNGGVSILTPDSNRSAIFLGHASDNLKLQIRHDGATSLGQIISDDALTFNVGDGTERMRIDANGHITMPTQSAFSANNSNAQQANIAVGSLVTVNFAVERFDQNSDFDNTNMVFTAPVTGRYLLTYTIRLGNVDSASEYYLTRINTSNCNYSMLWDSNEFSSDQDYVFMTNTALADMDANDTAKVIVYQNSGTQQTDVDDFSYFTGHLVC